jgi:signal recognition particle GTPase
MAEDIQYIKKQIKKEMNHLRDLYSKINRIERKKEPEKHSIKKLEQELMRKNPDIEIDRELLALVGTEPYNPPSQDKELVRRIVAERYG